MGFLIGFVFLVVGGLVVHLWYKSRQKGKTAVQSTVFLERVKRVCKLVLVEGNFSQVYTTEDKSSILFGLVEQNKRALLIVKAKASVGYDLQKMKYQVDKESKIITIMELPEAEIIGFDPEFQFYDFQQSWGNKFSAADLTALNNNALNIIKSDVMKSELPQLARQQAIESLKTLHMLSDGMGWQIEDKTKLLGVATEIRPGQE